MYLSSFVAISSGIAASLALVAKPRIVSLPIQQLLDVMVGAEIPVSLLPPAAVVGIGFALNQPEISFQALGLLAINVVCLDFIALLALYVRGVQLRPLQLEKKIREITKRTINDVVKADEISTSVTLHRNQKAEVVVRLEALKDQCGSSQLLAERISAKINEETGISNKVKIRTIQVCVSTS